MKFGKIDKLLLFVCFTTNIMIEKFWYSYILCSTLGPNPIFDSELYLMKINENKDFDSYLEIKNISERVQWLLAHDAFIGIGKKQIIGPISVLPLALAWKNYNWKEMSILLDKGACPNIIIIHQEQIFTTLLHMIVSTKNFPKEKKFILKKLIECGSNINILDGNNQTPLDILDDLKDDTEIRDILISFGAINGSLYKKTSQLKCNIVPYSNIVAWRICYENMIYERYTD